MKRLTVAEARRRLADALDHVEDGEPVLIERRGVTFELRVRPAGKRVRGRDLEPFPTANEASLGPLWEWAAAARGHVFHGTRQRGRKTRG